MREGYPGELLSRRTRLQPLGAAIDALPDRRAFTDATSTSPAAVVDGRWIDRLVPEVEAVATAPPAGSALSAGPAPDTAAPRTRASARNGT